MSINKAKETFKEMVDLCYEEDYPELHKEIVSLELATKKQKDTYKYERAMQELITIIPLFAEDFPQETFSQIEQLYEFCLENGY